MPSMLRRGGQGLWVRKLGYGLNAENELSSTTLKLLSREMGALAPGMLEALATGKSDQLDALSCWDALALGWPPDDTQMAVLRQPAQYLSSVEAGRRRAAAWVQAGHPQHAMEEFLNVFRVDPFRAWESRLHEDHRHF